MRVVKVKETGEIRSYLRSSDELTDGEGNRSIPGLSVQREVVDENLEGDNLETFLNTIIRPERDRLLNESDTKWIELASKDADLAAIKLYKQALRDFPENLDLTEIEYVDEIEWPSLGE